MSTTVLFGSMVLAGIASTSVGASGQTSGNERAGGQSAAPPVVNVQVTPGQPDKEKQEPRPEVPAVVDLSNPQIICGMKLWQVDPAIDPRIYKPLPEGAAGAKIRRIPAPECIPGASAAGGSVTVSSPIQEIWLPTPQSKSPEPSKRK